MARSVPGILDTLCASLAAIFDQVQGSLANHRKNCVALHKLHMQASAVTESNANGQAVKLVGERLFKDLFIEMVDRMLVVKKGPAAADRVVKFLGAYVKYLNEKVFEDKQKQASVQSDDDEDTIASRFVSRLLKWLLRGFTAKDKVVRFRAVQLVAEMTSHLGEMDEELYIELRMNLIERVCDKESLIRSHAVVALSRLAGSEDPNELSDDERSIEEVLLDILCFDPTAEVRRAALLHVPLTPTTLEVILTRTRDVDALTRKLVYSSVLQAKLGHPRHLTIAQREGIVKDGLGDREPAVRVAAGKLIVHWFDVLLSDAVSADDCAWTGDDSGIMRGFVEFLKIFDLLSPGKSIAVDAVQSIFVTRPDVLNVFTFPDAYWVKLSPESAVLARVFVEHCLATEDSTLLEAASIPVVTAVAFHIQEAYNVLLESIQAIEEVVDDDDNDRDEEEEDHERDKREEELAKQAVILSELLVVAVTLDYADEIGRRKVFTVVKDMLAHDCLPEELIPYCLDVLKVITPSERELIRVVVEAIVDLRDKDGDATLDEPCLAASQSDSTIQSVSLQPRDRTIIPARPRNQMSVEETMEADMIDRRCLTICIAMLERVHGSFEDNSTLEGILGDLIIPAVKRKELGLREKGLVCLGLCCLIAKNMALNSFQLFLSQVQTAPENLKFKVLQVVFDLLVMYEHEFFGRSEEISTRITAFLLHTLEAEESHTVQAVLAVGMSKLLLSGLVTDPKVLTSLLMVYVSPATADNLELRQCLSYFFPMYCYSSPANQSRVRSVFITAYNLVTRVHEDLEDDQEMITPYQFGLLLLDWTNPQKAADAAAGGPIRHVHTDLAVDILVSLYDSERQEHDQKTLCQLLGQLSLLPGADARALLQIKLLLDNADTQCSFEDAALDKMMGRFKDRFAKTYGEDLKLIDRRAYTDEEFQQLYTLIGIDPPTLDDDVSSVDKGTPAPSETHDDDAGSATDDTRSSSPTPAPRRSQVSTTPTATKRVRSKVVPLSPVSDDHSLDEDDKENTPAPTPSPAATVTPMKNAVKRLRSPAAKQMLSSPLNRKRNRVRDNGKAAKYLPADEEAPTRSRANKQIKGRTNTRQSRVVVSDEEDASQSDKEVDVDHVRGAPVRLSSEDMSGDSE